MNSWVYGFVEKVTGFDLDNYKELKRLGLKPKVEDFLVKELVLSEVYLEKGKPKMFIPLDWSDLSESDLKEIFTDLIDQVTVSKKHREKLWWKEAMFE